MSNEEEITKSLMIESQIWLTDDVDEDEVVLELEKQYGQDEEYPDEIVEEHPHGRRNCARCSYDRGLRRIKRVI